MKTMLIAILQLSSFWVNAQSAAKPTKEPEESISIKLAKFPIADFPKKSIAVSDITIIQMVRDSVQMGYALKGMDNYVVTLKISKPLTSFLQDHIYRMYKHEFNKQGIKILWVLKDLRMGEKTGFMEFAYARFNMDAYISGNGALYKKACTLDTVFVTESGSDVSKWHGEDIENAFKVLSKRTLLVAKNLPDQTVEDMTVEQIMKQSYQNLKVPILTDSIYIEGAYASFQEFLQNKPSIQKYESVVLDKKTIKFINTQQEKYADTLDIWGICKAGEIYRYYEESLIPIEKQGTGFIISNFIKNSNRRNRNIVFLSMMGGIAGGVVGGAVVSLAASAAKNKLLLVKSIPYITKSNKQPVASCIDMNTGDFSF
jgi:hypothetical protein